MAKKSKDLVYVNPNELKTFLNNPEKTQANEARIVVDVSKIKKAMMVDIVRFFDNLKY